MNRSLPFVLRPVVGLAVIAAIAAGCGDDDTASLSSAPDTTLSDTAVSEEMTDDAMTDEAMTDEAMTDEAMTDDVLAVAEAEGDLGTFLAALDAAGIMADLHGAGPFTLFVPTDAAFTSYLADSGMTQDDLLADPAALTTLLQNHIVNENETADMVMGMAGQAFTSAAGNPLEVTVDGDSGMVGAATVERYDLTAANGVVHVIDAVLVHGAGGQ